MKLLDQFKNGTLPPDVTNVQVGLGPIKRSFGNPIMSCLLHIYAIGEPFLVHQSTFQGTVFKTTIFGMERFH